MEHMQMKAQPKSTRPYERCMKDGPECLNDAELLAVILRTGTKTQTAVELAATVLQKTKIREGLPGLVHLSIPELMEVSGIGLVKAVQIQCIGELARRISAGGAEEELVISDPKQAAERYMQRMRFMEQEQMLLLLMNTRHVLIKEIFLTKGTVNASVITPREILVEALRYQAVSFLLLHNHPSGNPEPSREDVFFTKRVKESARLVGITLDDHIVIGNNQYISFKERGIL